MGLSEKERIRVLQCVGVCERERGDAKNEENRCMKKSDQWRVYVQENCRERKSRMNVWF